MSINFVDPTRFTSSLLIGGTTGKGESNGNLPSLTRELLDGKKVPVAAALEIQAKDAALLLPRLTSAERDALNPPSVGMIIYNTTTHCLNIYQKNGVDVSWQTVESGPGNGDVVGPNGDVQKNKVALFADETGKFLTGSSASFQVVQDIVQLTDIQEINFTGAANFITVNDRVVSAVSFQKDEPLTVFTDSTYDSDTSLNSCSLIEMNSTRAGFLNARMNTFQMNNIPTPIDGLQVYNTDTNSLHVYQNGAWVALELFSNPATADATYITQTPSPTLTESFSLSRLSTGILKNTTGTGVLSIASPISSGNLDGDFYAPGSPLYFYGDEIQNIWISNQKSIESLGENNTVISSFSGSSFASNAITNNILIGSLLSNQNVNYDHCILLGENIDGPGGNKEKVSDVIGIGRNVTVFDQSIAIGGSAASSGSHGISIGNLSSNDGAAYGICIGGETSNKSSESLAIGYLCKNDDSSRGATIIGNGSSNILSPDSLLIGRNSCTQASSAIVLGRDNLVKDGQSAVIIGSDSHVFSSEVIAIGSAIHMDSESSNSVAIGKASSCLFSSYGIAIGDHSACHGSEGGISIGYSSSSNQEGGISIGNNSSCDGQNSSAIGSNTTVSINNAINLGNDNVVGINNAVPMFSLDINNVTNIGGVDVTAVKIAATPTAPDTLATLLPVNSGMLFINNSDKTGQLYYAYNDGSRVSVNKIQYS